MRPEGGKRTERRPRAADQLRRHRLGARIERTGTADDAGPGPVLRRHGAYQERSEHAHDELRDHFGGQYPVGLLRVQPVVHH